LTAQIPETKLPPIPLPGGIPGSLVVTIAGGSTLTSELHGVCASVANGQARYVASTTTHGALKLVPAIEIDVPLAGKKTFDVPPVDVDVPMVTGALDLGSASATQLGAPPAKNLAGSTGTQGACEPQASPPPPPPPSPPPPADAGADDGAAPPDADDDAGPVFDVKKVPGLALWLAGDSGVSDAGGLVLRWADQSGNKNDATQVEPVSQPILVDQSINLQPGVRFTSTRATQLVIGDSGSLRWGTNDFLIVVVARYSNPETSSDVTGAGCLFSKSPAFGSGPALFANTPPAGSAKYSGTGLAAFLDGSRTVFSSKTGLNDATPHAFAVRRSGGTLELRLDGNVVGTSTVTTANVSALFADVRIGSDSAGSKWRLDGEIAEIVAVGQALRAGDLTAIEAYLKQKYAL
jgi:hypothetical protein